MGRALDQTQSSEGFAALFRLSPVGILISGTQGEVLDANEAAERLLGRSLDEMHGKTSAELGLIAPEVREKLFERVRTEGMQHAEEVSVALPSGERRELLVSVQPVSMNGQSRYVTTFLDVTERRRSEARFRSLLEAAPDGMILVGIDGRISLVNTRIEEMFGYARGDLMGEPVEKLLPERYRAAHGGHRARFFEVPRVRPMGVGRQLWALRKDGTEFAVEISLSPLTAQGAEPLAIAAVRDVSERKQLEARMVFVDRMASIGTLAAGIAHEINTPLACLTSNLELMTRARTSGGTNGGPTFETLVDEAQRDAERVRRIVHGVQAFSRTSDERRGQVDVRDALGRSLEMTANEIRHRARVVRRFEPAPPVTAEEMRLAQVFINLLLNAAQAIPEGHAEHHTITVSTRARGEGVEIEIRDTGCGIPADVLGRVFDPFFTTKAVGEGSGLGLSICHGIVVGLGGTITVESHVGVGSVFRVWLPATSRPASSAAVPDVPAARPAPPRAGSRGRVLVVDDDVMLGTTMSHLLEDDYDVTVVTSGRDALARIAADGPFDVVLSDLMMPEVSGMELYEEISKRRPELVERVVFVTGGAFTPAAQAFLDAVPNTVLLKPFSSEALHAAVRALVA